MLFPQIVKEEAAVSLIENQNQESKTQQEELKMTLVLMAIEIERLHKIVNYKIDCCNQEYKDFVRRGQNYVQYLELIYKGQIAEYFNVNIELNQQIVQKNAFISQIINENSQQEINKLITQQCANFEQELKLYQQLNLQLQRENEVLQSQLKVTPQLRKKLNEINQFYSQSFTEKNQELQELKENNIYSKLVDHNQHLQNKELEFLEQYASFEQTNLMNEHMNLKKELKFLNEKLNLLINDNETLREQLYKSQNNLQATFYKNGEDQGNLTPERKQKQQIFPAFIQFINNHRTNQRTHCIQSNTPVNYITHQKILIHKQSQSQPQQNNNGIHFNVQFNEIIRQILQFENQKLKTIQSIQNQISLIKRLLDLKQSEISQYQIQNRIINNNQINQVISSPQVVTYPYSNQIQQNFSISPSKFYTQQFSIQQTYIKNPAHLSNQRIKTEIQYLSNTDIAHRSKSPTIIQVSNNYDKKPQNTYYYHQKRQQPGTYYNNSPIQKTLVKQNNPIPCFTGVLPNNAAQINLQFQNQINVSHLNNQTKFSTFNNQGQKIIEKCSLPGDDIDTTEFQVNPQYPMNNQGSQIPHQKDQTNQNFNPEEGKQENCFQDRRQTQNLSKSIQQIKQIPSEVSSKAQILNKITLEDPVIIEKRYSNFKEDSEINYSQVGYNSFDKDYLNFVEQYQDFRLMFKQLQKIKEQEHQQIYCNVLKQLQNLEDQFKQQSGEYEKQKLNRNQRDNKFNRVSNENMHDVENQLEFNGTYDLIQSINQLRSLLNQQQILFRQIIQLQNEFQTKCDKLIPLQSQKEQELNTESINIRKDCEDQKLDFKLKQQSEEINLVQRQNSSLKQQILDYTNQIQNLQQILKFEQDQHKITKQLAQAVQLETEKNINLTIEIQNRNNSLEQQITEKQQQLLELQHNLKTQLKKDQMLDKSTQSIFVQNEDIQEQSQQQDQIQNLQQQLNFESQQTKQLNDQITILQQQIQAQEQLLQFQKLNNENQSKDIQNLIKEKVEISQLLKTEQAKNIELEDQTKQIQLQQEVRTQQNLEQPNNNDMIQKLNYQIEEMRQINQFLSNQQIQIQQNSEIQISAQNTVLQSRIAHLEKQLTLEKQLKEQANIKILQLEKQLHSIKNNVEKDQYSEIKENILQSQNDQNLLQEKQKQIQILQFDLNSLRLRVNDLEQQIKNYQEKIKLFEEKQQMQFQLEKKYNNQADLINKYEQQIVSLNQEINQYQIDLLNLRQGLKLDIQGFEIQQYDQINNLKNQVDNLNYSNKNLQEDLDYLQSQLQFEQREKNIISKNKTILDGEIKQLQEENMQLKNQLLNHQNDIELLNQQFQQFNSIDISQFQIKNQRIQIQKNDENEKSTSLEIQMLNKQNKDLIEECQHLKDILQQNTKEKDKLQRILNYYSQDQEGSFHENHQFKSQTIIEENEEQIQVQPNQFQIEQVQFQNLNNTISIALVELNQLNAENEQLKQEIQEQIQRLKQQIIQIQEVKKKLQIEKDQNDFSIQQKIHKNNFNQKIDDLTQIIQELNVKLGGYLQLNINLQKTSSILTHILTETNKMIEEMKNQNHILNRVVSNDEQQKFSLLQYKQLIMNNEKLQNKQIQYEQILKQLQDEYFKQGSALQSLTKEYQKVINQNEVSATNNNQLEQLKVKLSKQENQLEQASQQNLILQKQLDQEKKKISEEITKSNNLILEIQKQKKNINQITQENIQLNAKIAQFQSELQNLNSNQNTQEEQIRLNQQNQEEQNQLKKEIQNLYQRILQMSNSYNLLKEEKEQELLNFQRELRQLQESLENQKNENKQNKAFNEKFEKGVQYQKNQSDSNLLQEIKKVQSKLEISLLQQKSIQDEKRTLQAQVYQQLEQLASQLNTIKQLKIEISKQEQIIQQLSQQNNIQSSFVQEVTLTDDQKQFQTQEFRIKQLQNQITHLQQLLIDTENNYTHKIKMQQLQIQGLNDKLRDLLYENNRKTPYEEQFTINSLDNQ